MVSSATESKGKYLARTSVEMFADASRLETVQAACVHERLPRSTSFAGLRALCPILVTGKGGEQYGRVFRLSQVGFSDSAKLQLPTHLIEKC